MYRRLTREEGGTRTVKPVAMYRTAVGRCSFSARVFRIWELLPDDLRFGDLQKRHVKEKIKSNIKTWDKEWVLWGKEYSTENLDKDETSTIVETEENITNERPNSEEISGTNSEIDSQTFVEQDCFPAHGNQLSSHHTVQILLELNEMFAENEEYEASKDEIMFKREHSMRDAREVQYSKEKEDKVNHVKKPLMKRKEEKAVTGCEVNLTTIPEKELVLSGEEETESEGRTKIDLQSLLEADRPQQKQSNEQHLLCGNIFQGRYIKCQEADRPLATIIFYSNRKFNFKTWTDGSRVASVLVICKIQLISIESLVSVQLGPLERQGRMVEPITVFVGTGFVT